jgi:hypothetical protein
MSKLNIDRTPRLLTDTCLDCKKPLVKGINYSGWNVFSNCDGVLATSPVCDSCLRARNGSGEKDLQDE